MLKRTISFDNPYHLSIKLKQLMLTDKETGAVLQRPIEDLGFIILNHPQITFTQAVMQEMAANNTAVVFCDEKHHPCSMLFHLDGHQVQNEHFRAQVSASQPLMKQLWQQTIVAKVRNQAAVLERTGESGDALRHISTKVKSGDTDNQEAKAARHYWKKLFGPTFTRERFGAPPNPTLNFGYAILRAAVARALVGSGLLPTLGIHHHNKYNAYCLADDIMEPYRPYVDLTVWELRNTDPAYHVMKPSVKESLLGILSCDVCMGKKKRPLMVALSETTASLSQCFAGERKKIKYPTL